MFSIARKDSTLIIGLRPVFLFALINGGISDSFILLPVCLCAKRDNSQMKMPGGHAGRLALIASMLIVLQGHALSIAALFVLSGTRITQRAMDSVLVSAPDRAMHIIVTKPVEPRFQLPFSLDALVVTMLIDSQSSV